MRPHDNNAVIRWKASSDKPVAAIECGHGTGRDTVMFCKHVGRLASDHACVIFRRQVAESGRRMCEGCIIDTVLYRPQESVRDCVRVCNA